MQPGGSWTHLLVALTPAGPVLCINFFLLLLGHSQHCISCVSRELLQQSSLTSYIPLPSQQAFEDTINMRLTVLLRRRHSQAPRPIRPSASCRGGALSANRYKF